MITRSDKVGTKYIYSIGSWLVFYKPDGRADTIGGWPVYYRQDGRIDNIGGDFYFSYKQDGRIEAIGSNHAVYNSAGDMQYVGPSFVSYGTIYPAKEKREIPCNPSTSHATVFKPAPTTPYTRPLLDQLSDLDWRYACNIL